MITIQKHIKALMVLFSAFVVTSCNNYIVDYAGDVYIIFVNNSSHNIEIIREDTNAVHLEQELPKNIKLAPGEDISLDTRTAYVYPYFTTIIFDECVKMIFSKEDNSSHNIMKRGNYEEDYSSKTHTTRYVYTFTDDDYQYALENGTPLERPTVNG